MPVSSCDEAGGETSDEASGSKLSLDSIVAVPIAMSGAGQESVICHWSATLSESSLKYLWCDTALMPISGWGLAATDVCSSCERFFPPSSKSAGSSGNGSVDDDGCGKSLGKPEIPASWIIGLVGRAIMFAIGAGLLIRSSNAGTVGTSCC